MSAPASAMDAGVRAILEGMRTWAVVGCSPDPGRDAHQIAALDRCPAIELPRP